MPTHRFSPSGQVVGLKSSLEREFDRAAATYESHKLAGWHQAQNSWLLDHLDSPRGPVVDIGCGTGWFLRRLAERHPGITGLGVDISTEMIRRGRSFAKSDGVQGLEFLQGDWERAGTEKRALGRLSGAAALVTCVGTLQYFEEPVVALLRMRRLLKPGGRLLIVEQAIDTSSITRVWGFVQRQVVRNGARHYSEDELASLIEEAGFENVEPVDRLQRVLWKGKFNTSLVMLQAVPGPASSAARGSSGHRVREPLRHGRRPKRNGTTH